MRIYPVVGTFPLESVHYLFWRGNGRGERHARFTDSVNVVPGLPAVKG